MAHRIPRRKRFFIGCEGESEQAYASLLNRYSEIMGLHVHLVAVNLQPAGDSLMLAQRAISKYSIAKARGAFDAKAIFLDFDKREELPQQGRDAAALLEDNGFIQIWQRPDHEGFLLRHFPGQERVEPTRGRSAAALIREWPNYRKNMPALEIKKTLSLDHIKRATEYDVQFLKLLTKIGILPTAGDD